MYDSNGQVGEQPYQESGIPANGFPNSNVQVDLNVYLQLIQNLHHDSLKNDFLIQRAMALLAEAYVTLDQINPQPIRLRQKIHVLLYGTEK